MTRLRSFLKAKVLPRSAILRLRILEPVTVVLGNVTEIGAKDIAIATTFRKQTLMEMQVTLTIAKTDAMTGGILMSIVIMGHQDGAGPIRLAHRIPVEIVESFKEYRAFNKCLDGKSYLLPTYWLNS